MTAPTAYVEPPPESCVHRLFEARVKADPTATALVDAGGRLTYQEVNERANRLARLLVTNGVRTGDLVGLRVPRSAACVIAMIAVLKAGAGYVHLEDVMPLRRLRAIANECDLRLVITASPLGWRAADGRPVLSLDDEEAALAGTPGTDLCVDVRPSDVMYVPYTSGSTGAPKGIRLPHRSMPGLLQGTGCVQWGPSHNSLHHCALSWDGHVVEIFPVLLSGGSVVIFEGDAGDPLAVATFARVHDVTTLVLTAAALNVVVTEDPTRLSGVRHLITGGEAASRPHIAKALAALPNCRIVNGYGPVECNGLTTAHRIRAEDLDRSSIPIGRPVGDRVVYVLRPDGGLAPDGEAGELCVGGPAVADGYVGMRGASAETFVPDPFSPFPGARMYRTGDMVRRTAEGVFEFLGRYDEQVKIRGVRVEPGEVTAALRSSPLVADAAVLADHGSSRGVRLIAYVLPTPETDPGELSTSLVTHLRERLPTAMLPGAIVPVRCLPRTRTGKVDREALHAAQVEHLAHGIAGSAPTGTHPVTELQGLVAGICADLLERSAVGLDDNFFDLGGHSLLASQVLARVHRRSGVGIPLRRFYEAPTPRGLAAAVEAVLRDGDEGGTSRASSRPPQSAPPATAPIRRTERTRVRLARPAAGGGSAAGSRPEGAERVLEEESPHDR
ncbi:non-ribosomal peptide synthetase [Microbispora sp. H10670]|uniref:non-ribosomal peptide synthetase n=1 Tax=Microbispora sp. H10670 TaxID=2729108 RepID=UPI0015FEBA19|nr:non-ribosomal peptide synthetase [Microbispora sp. H10670]